MRDICLVFLRFWCHKNLSWGTFLLFAECKIGISSSDVWKNSPATSSGPLIFSVKIFLITDSVNLMYTEPLRFSVSSCIHFGKLCFSRIPAVSSVRLIRTVFVVALLDIRSDVPLFVPVLSAVSLSFPHEFCYWFCRYCCHFKELLALISRSSTSLFSALTFSPFLSLGLICSSSGS